MPFKIANCNGFSFNACPLGLSPNGTLHLPMILYDPRTALYVHNNEDICLFTNIDTQILYFLFGLMDYLQHNLQYTHNCCNMGRTVFLSIITLFLLMYIQDVTFLFSFGLSSFCSHYSKFVKMYNIFTYRMEECGILFLPFSYLCTYHIFL